MGGERVAWQAVGKVKVRVACWVEVKAAWMGVVRVVGTARVLKEEPEKEWDRLWAKAEKVVNTVTILIYLNYNFLLWRQLV